MYTDIYTPNNDYANQALRSIEEFMSDKSEGGDEQANEKSVRKDWQINDETS